MSTILRTRIGKDILCEFSFPNTKSNKVVILAKGLPSSPQNEGVMQFLNKRGYWTFLPRYRGSWESDGWFLEKSPHEDILAVIRQVKRGHIHAIENGKNYRIKNPKIFLIGNSFGGAAVLIASLSRDVVKTAALSPVVDWQLVPKKQFDERFQYISRAFGQGFRSKPQYVKRFMSGVICNPTLYLSRLDLHKILIIHPQDDPDLDVRVSRLFSDKLGNKLITPKTGGHLGLSNTCDRNTWKAIQGFFN